MWFQYKNHNSSYNFFFINCLCQNTLQFWPSCQRILLLLSKSVKATILLQNRTLSLSVLVKGLFCLPLLKDSFFKGVFILLPLSKGPFFYCPHLWSWSHSQWLAERRICSAVWVSLYPLLPLLYPHQTFINVKWCIQLYKNIPV